MTIQEQVEVLNKITHVMSENVILVVFAEDVVLRDVAA